MSQSTKKLEVIQVRFTTENDFTFFDLLKSDTIEEYEIWIKGKWVTVSILQKGRNVIIGIVVTTRSTNVPPKKKRGNKRVRPLGLDDDEGLAYANAFLYDSSNRVLLYEVNKFGCYLDHFKEFFFRGFEDHDQFIDFNIDFEPVLTSDEYNRVLRMNPHKSLEVVLANPQNILQEFDGQNNAVIQMLRTASTIGSEKFRWKYEVAARSPRSLANRTLRQIIDQLLRIYASPVGENIEKIEVKGYEDDPDEERIAKIDLIADRFQASIILEEPRENTDLLQQERKDEIQRVYRQHSAELNKILS